MKIEKLSCSYAMRYQGLREPKCGCASCWIKYLERRLDAVVTMLAEDAEIAVAKARDLSETEKEANDTGC